MSKTTRTPVQTLVFCRDSNGQAAIYHCEVLATPEEVEDGTHFKEAVDRAEAAGYTAELSGAFDEYEPLGVQLLPLLEVH